MIIGGSADLAGSNNTKTKNHKPLVKITLKEIIFIMELENMPCGYYEWFILTQ